MNDRNYLFTTLDQAAIDEADRVTFADASIATATDRHIT